MQMVWSLPPPEWLSWGQSVTVVLHGVTNLVTIAFKSPKRVPRHRDWAEN